MRPFVIPRTVASGLPLNKFSQGAMFRAIPSLGRTLVERPLP